MGRVKLRWAANAIKDLYEIKEYLVRKNPRVLKTTVFTIKETINRLIKFPFMGVRYSIEGTRKIILPGIPFKIIYRFRNDELEILSILHHSKD
jgi:addiction module RelE/StbE family toxin